MEWDGFVSENVPRCCKSSCVRLGKSEDEDKVRFFFKLPFFLIKGIAISPNREVLLGFQGSQG